ncbi:hypothetical protein [Stenotrophomonas maltophilia]|uniref:Uncharacterized protein n=1 Tax=Stenotrophomonas maltophilia TaxID=40324 RepID=A0AAJ2MUT9_STEMA|nr:hypothetical protein [Stenotrophomonas maltophilia]MDT3468945.1 hypothetical protein [Stenotrophomonas maltophilia]
MSKFFVGQRVRIVGTEGPKGPWHMPPPTGKNGRIVKEGAIGATTQRHFDWEVLVDDFGPVQCDSHEIEPVSQEVMA